MSMFDDEALSRIAQETAIAQVPEDHKVALVGIVNKDSAKLALMLKIKDNWNIQAYTSLKDHDFDYGAYVMWSK